MKRYLKTTVRLFIRVKRNQSDYQTAYLKVIRTNFDQVFLKFATFFDCTELPQDDGSTRLVRKLFDISKFDNLWPCRPTPRPCRPIERVWQSRRRPRQWHPLERRTPRARLRESSRGRPMLHPFHLACSLSSPWWRCRWLRTWLTSSNTSWKAWQTRRRRWRRSRTSACYCVWSSLWKAKCRVSRDQPYRWFGLPVMSNWLTSRTSALFSCKLGDATSHCVNVYNGWSFLRKYIKMFVSTLHTLKSQAVAAEESGDPVLGASEIAFSAMIDDMDCVLLVKYVSALEEKKNLLNVTSTFMTENALSFTSHHVKNFATALSRMHKAVDKTFYVMCQRLNNQIELDQLARRVCLCSSSWCTLTLESHQSCRLGVIETCRAHLQRAAWERQD